MHEPLFSGNSWRLGQIHWRILKADSEMEMRREVVIRDGATDRRETTEFDEEVGKDEISWWVSKREDHVDELWSRTERLLLPVKKLKDDAKALAVRLPKSYGDLMSALKGFSDSHGGEIDVLEEYVTWLCEKDVLAPTILYTDRVWGTTRRSERWMPISAGALESEEPAVLQALTLTVFGLLRRERSTLERVRRDAEYEAYEGVDPSDVRIGPIRIPERHIIARAAYEAFEDLATYFEHIQKSLRNILLEIEKYKSQRELIASEAFWRKFIPKAMEASRVESQLWDFKETLELWHAKDPTEKTKHAVAFCEQVACYANADGGVLILGVTNTPPREVVGIGKNLAEIEARLKHLSTVLPNHITYPRDYLHFQQVVLTDELGAPRTCLVIVIAQTAEAVAVAFDRGGGPDYTYPVRRETGLEKVAPWDLHLLKRHVKSDNFDFVQRLEQFVYDR